MNGQFFAVSLWLLCIYYFDLKGVFVFNLKKIEPRRAISANRKGKTLEVDRESGITADMKGKTQGIDREKY
ncbi:hypothetical protein [Lentibacillus daqui]|uniref:hypothetical protein n=1 Tax=Lentibacillus daqui TaxID=2911514 RepID=UPI0022B0DFBF|nr:hypothetical protein [Lentibacillus daqui]